MSNDKALAIVPRTIDEVRVLSAMLSRSSLLPGELRGKEADVAVSILAGQELGLPPMAAIRGVHVVKGKPILSADTMVGVVLGRGIAKYFSCMEESPESVTYETHRVGDPRPQRMTWTMEDAKRAGLAGGDNWKKYPRAMLKARCKAALARDVYPDVLAGYYTHDEMGAPDGPVLAPQEVDDVEDAETVPPDADIELATVLALIESAPTIADLNALRPQIKALPEPQRSQAWSAGAARSAEVRAAAPHPDDVATERLPPAQGNAAGRAAVSAALGKEGQP